MDNGENDERDGKMKTMWNFIGDGKKSDDPLNVVKVKEKGNPILVPGMRKGIESSSRKYKRQLYWRGSHNLKKWMAPQRH